jgi:methionine-gamma-lyase
MPVISAGSIILGSRRTAATLIDQLPPRGSPLLTEREMGETFVPSDDEPGLDATSEDAALATQIIHCGESESASAFPIFQANTVDGTYIRMRNPTTEALEEKMRQLEGGALSLATASGMAAVSQTLLAILRAGSRIIVHQSIFIGVQTLLSDFIARLGIEVVQIDLNSADALAEATQRPADAIYFETLSNPKLEVVNPSFAVAAARKCGARVIVDNTILTPVICRPLQHGADVVIHSATKYLAGHGDVLAGIATFRDVELAKQVHKSRRILGGVLSPLSAYLVMRGMKTLPLRVAKHCENAQRVAAFLETQPLVQRVHYPGLPSSPYHAAAKSFLDRFGGLVSFDPRDDFDWDGFRNGLGLCRTSMSFGDPATRMQKEGPIRISVGLEDADDILADLECAFSRCAKR